jgi:hypothetical protein
MYEDYYAKQSGGEMPVFMGGRQQRGHGIGNFFARVKRFAIPLLKRGAQFLLPKIFKTGSEIMNDVTHGQNIKDALKSRVTGAIKESARDLFGQSGSGHRKRNIEPVKRNKLVKRLKL